MGNENSKAEGAPSEYRSRSLSPLPREDQFPWGANDDLTAAAPSTMPATLKVEAPDDTRHRDPATRRRRRRSPSPSPEPVANGWHPASPELAPLSASQPPPPAARPPSPDQPPWSATQTHPSEGRRPRVSKKKRRPSLETKSEQNSRIAKLSPAGKDALLQELRRRRQRSPAPSPFAKEKTTQQPHDAVQQLDGGLQLDDDVGQPHKDLSHEIHSGGGRPNRTQKDGNRPDRNGEGSQSAANQSGGNPSDGNSSDGNQSDRSFSGRDQSDGDQSGGDQSGGIQSGGIQSGGDQSSGDQSDGDQSDGDQSDGDQSGGIQSDGDQSDGAQQLDGGQQREAAQQGDDGAPGQLHEDRQPSRNQKRRDTAAAAATAAELQNADEEAGESRLRDAAALAELPFADAEIPPSPESSTRAQPHAESQEGPSIAARRLRPRKPKPQPAAGAGIEASDGEAAPESSHYRTGPFTKTEQSQITRAVERFREDEGLTQQEVNQLIQEDPRQPGSTLHSQLWASIRDACPSRPRRKIMMWCRQHFHNFVGRGTWTPAQDDELAELIELHGKRWSQIGGLINRHPMDVRDRWRNYLVCRGAAKTAAWSEEEEDRFREVVEKSIEKIRKGLSPGSRKSPEELINWLKISEAMGYTRSRLQCMEKWKRMRASEPLGDQVPTVLPRGSSWRLEKARRDLRQVTPDDKYILMCAIRDSGVVTDSKINWKRIVDSTFHGKYERQALVVVWGRLRQAVPDWEWKTTRDCAGYLCEMYEREGDFAAAGVPRHDSDGDDAAPAQEVGKEVLRPSSPMGASSTASPPATPVEREQSPDLGAGSPEAPSSAETEGAQPRRQEGQVGTAEPSNKGKERESVPASATKPNSKASKRHRRGSSSANDGTSESTRSKKPKTSKTDGAKAANKDWDVEDDRGWSVISSDMDDMEDIPATMPSLKRAPRRNGAVSSNRTSRLPVA